MSTYYNVRRLIVEDQGGEERAKYGGKLIIDYSIKLSFDLNRKFHFRALWWARKFYLLVSSNKIMSTQLSWSHYVELLPLVDVDAINYYVKISVEYRLSVRQLRGRILSGEYRRLDENTKFRLIKRGKPRIEDFIKNPILIKNGLDFCNVSEDY